MSSEFSVYCIATVSSPPAALSRRKTGAFYCHVAVPIADQLVIFCEGNWEHEGQVLDVTLSYKDDELLLGKISEHNRCLLWKRNSSELPASMTSDAEKGLAKILVDNAEDVEPELDVAVDSVGSLGNELKEINENTPQFTEETTTKKDAPDRPQKRRTSLNKEDKTPNGPVVKKQKTTRLRNLQGEESGNKSEQKKKTSPKAKKEDKSEKVDDKLKDSYTELCKILESGDGTQKTKSNKYKKKDNVDTSFSENKDEEKGKAAKCQVKKQKAEAKTSKTGSPKVNSEQKDTPKQRKKGSEPCSVSSPSSETLKHKNQKDTESPSTSGVKGERTKSKADKTKPAQKKTEQSNSDKNGILKFFSPTKSEEADSLGNKQDDNKVNEKTVVNANKNVPKKKTEKSSEPEDKKGNEKSLENKETNAKGNRRKSENKTELKKEISLENEDLKASKRPRRSCQDTKADSKEIKDALSTETEEPGPVRDMGQSGAGKEGVTGSSGSGINVAEEDVPAGVKLATCRDVTLRALERPSARWGHSLSFINKKLSVLIGGQGEKSQICKDSVWTLDTETRRWKDPDLPSEGLKPELRMGHTATYDPTVRCIYVFGGSKNTRWFHDVHMLDLDEWKWQLVKVNGKAPTRAYHSATLYRHEVWIFGGVYPRPDPQPDGCSNDIHIFSPVMDCWYDPIVSGEKPLARSGHSADLLEDQLVVFGGWDAPISYSDLHVLDMSIVEWSQPEFTGSPPSPRSWHASCALSNKRVLIHGGYNGDIALDDSHIFNLIEKTWTRVYMDHKLTARVGHKCLCMPYRHDNEEEDEVMIFGGGDNDGNYFDDLYSIYVPFNA